jgi:dipeptidase E
VHVFLGSQGLGAFPGWLDELPSRPRRVALIPTAGNPLPATPWVDVARGVLAECGLTASTLDLEGAGPDAVDAVLDSVDLVFVTGGQPIFLLEHAQLSGFATAVPHAVRAGRLAYAGVSAGAILTAPDLALYDAPDDPGEVKSTTGLGLAPFYPLVHTNRGRHDRYTRLIAANPGLDFIPYNDDEALVLTDGLVDRRSSPITPNLPHSPNPVDGPSRPTTERESARPRLLGE